MHELGEWAWHLYDLNARSVPNTDLTRACWKIHLAASGMIMATPVRTKRRGKLQLVKATYEMNTEVFCLHFTHRHGDSLAGQMELSNNITFDAEQAYRAFHFRLHQTRADLEHEHEPDPPEAGVEGAIECLIDQSARGWYELAGCDGFVAVFPDGTVATRFKGEAEVHHHQNSADATDWLLGNEGVDPTPMPRGKKVRK